MTGSESPERRVVIGLREDGTIVIVRENISAFEASALIVSAYRMEMLRIDLGWRESLDRETDEPS